MKNNKLKQKWNSLPLYTRDVACRLAAAVAALLFLMGMSEVVKSGKDKKSEAKNNKTTQVVQEIPESYLQFREVYKQQQQKQK